MGLITGLFKAAFLLFSVSGFSMAGLNKLTDKISPETYQYLAAQAPRWHEVLPTIQNMDFKQFISATDYLPAIGYTEIIGAMLLIIPGFHRIGTFVLLGVSGGAIYTHLQLGESPLPPVLLGGSVLALYLLRSMTGHKSKSKTS